MKQAGFTLVELMAVVVILGILAAVGIPQYRKTMERAQGAEAYSGLAQIHSAEKIHYTANQTYLGGSAPLHPTVKATLDLIFSQKEWNFGISATATTFTAVATRKSGPCSGTTITINHIGEIVDSPWKNCVNITNF